MVFLPFVLASFFTLLLSVCGGFVSLTLRTAFRGSRELKAIRNGFFINPSEFRCLGFTIGCVDLRKPSSVEMFVNGSLFRRDSSPPFTFTEGEWEQPAPGAVNLTCASTLGDSVQVLGTIDYDAPIPTPPPTPALGPFPRLRAVPAGSGGIATQGIPIFDNRELPLFALSPEVSIICDAPGANKAVFSIDGTVVRREFGAPFAIAGNQGNNAFRWNFPVGRVKIECATTTGQERKVVSANADICVPRS